MIKLIPKKPTRAFGEDIEKLVGKYLKKHGLKLVENNFNCKVGEIDLIMRDQNSLVFVEVRYRQHASHGSGLETVGYYKQRKLIKAAMVYLQRKRLTDKIASRFDVVSVTDTADGKEYLWVKNAFQVS